MSGCAHLEKYATRLHSAEAKIEKLTKALSIAEANASRGAYGTASDSVSCPACGEGFIPDMTERNRAVAELRKAASSLATTAWNEEMFEEKCGNVFHWLDVLDRIAHEPAQQVPQEECQFCYGQGQLSGTGCNRCGRKMP